MKTTPFTMLLVAFAASLWAQAAPPPPTPTPSPAATATPEPPKPAPELAKLQFMVGDWTHEEIHHGQATGVPARGAARSKIAWILGGHRLYITYKSLSARGEHEGRGLLGWDVDEKSYRLDWYDNRGQAVRYTGGFNPEEALVLAGEPTVDGQRMRQQLTIKKQPGGKFLLTDESAPADQVPKLTLESLAQAAPTPTATPTPGARTAPGGTPTPDVRTTPPPAPPPSR